MIITKVMLIGSNKTSLSEELFKASDLDAVLQIPSVIVVLLFAIIFLLIPSISAKSSTLLKQPLSSL